MTADEHRRASLARRGMYEHAIASRELGSSAAEWEERVREYSPDTCDLVGQKTIDAIVALVFLPRRRR